MAHSHDDEVSVGSSGSGCFGCALPFPLGIILGLFNRPTRPPRRPYKKKGRKHQARKRGALLVYSRGKILLVMDRGHHKWSLPGGGVKKGEKSFQTAIRELHEELNLKVQKLHWLGHFKGARSLHSIYFSNQATGEIHLQTKELKRYFWWDMKGKIKAYGHVWSALKLAKEKKYI